MMAIFSLKPKKRQMPFLLFFLSFGFFLLAQILPFWETKAVIEKMKEASRIMSQATYVLKECRKDKALSIDPSSDINQTGLIGTRLSMITTSLGNLESKRTTTNPNFAGLIVYLLKEAGVEEGDTIAVGASGSFPALIVAVLSASKAMDLNPLIITSLGASQWGANLPDFHWLHMQDCLWDNGVFTYIPVAVSLGGEQDRGEDMEEEGRSLFMKAMAESGIPVVNELGLEPTVETKMRLYTGAAKGQPIKAFVNIGGSWSNLGTDPEVLNLKPGLVRFHRIPPKENRGVLFEMAAGDVPVIHLLFIRGLVERFGLAWDPVPLPQPGVGRIYERIEEAHPSFLYISLAFFVLLFILLAIGFKKSL
jgi:poly-gamma-glutamate system protein